jgi:predicted anti-sigma-YlaC factor YlaD
VHGNCERARQWASLELDGELSNFERGLLESHLATCRSCSTFRAEVTGLTGALRAAPHEPFEGVVIGRMRRHVRMRLAPAAAAMAVAAVGLGSLVASSALQSGGLGRVAAQSVDVTPAAAATDTMNLSASKANARALARPAGRLPAGAGGTLQGGPVVSQR